MNRKSFGVLLALAAVFVVLAIVGQRPSTTRSIAGDSAGGLLLPNLSSDLESIDEILVDGAGRQRQVTLERAAERFTVAELDGYAADRGTVNGLLIALAEARIAEEMTADPAFHSRLGVEAIDEPEAAGVEVTLVAGDGDRYSVVLGHSYGGGQRYARVAGEDLSVVIDRDPEVPMDPSDWVDTGLVDIPAERVQRVEITHADGERLTLLKPGRDAGDFTVEGIPDGRELQYAGVANATGNLLDGLRLDEVRRQADEPAEPATTTEFSTFDGLVVTVTSFGAGDDAPWLAFTARFDAGQALDFATGTVDAGIADAAGADVTDADALDAEAVDADVTDGDTADGDAAGADAADEAEAINARLAGWQYRIPSYQQSQLTRRIEDLLRPLPDEADE